MMWALCFERESVDLLRREEEEEYKSKARSLYRRLYSIATRTPFYSLISLFCFYPTGRANFPFQCPLHSILSVVSRYVDMSPLEHHSLHDPSCHSYRCNQSRGLFLPWLPRMVESPNHEWARIAGNYTRVPINEGIHSCITIWSVNMGVIFMNGSIHHSGPSYI
jgi:hypothetical protein